MTIDRRGRVTHVDPINGPPVFHDSPTTYAEKWSFEAMNVEGSSVDITFLLTLCDLVE